MKILYMMPMLLMFGIPMAMGVSSEYGIVVGTLALMGFLILWSAIFHFSFKAPSRSKSSICQ